APGRGASGHADRARADLQGPASRQGGRAMKLHELRPPEGSHRKRRRIGRGHGSGRGTTAGKGTKGQKARSGGGVPLYFEGGQLPLVRRLPYRRGFKNPFRVEFAIVNVGQLAGLAAGTEVTSATLVEL